MINPLSLPPLALAQAPSPEQISAWVLQSKTNRSMGVSFDAQGMSTLGGGSMDAWLDAQPWPEASLRRELLADAL